MSAPGGSYRKRPVIIRALRWTGDNIAEVIVFMRPQEPIYVNNLSHMKFTNADDVVGIETLEGIVVAAKGDWIIRGTAGELYPCKPEIFEDVYEPVEAGDPA